MGRVPGNLRTWFFAVCLFGLPGALQASDASTKGAGQYQLLAATVTASTGAGVVEVSSLFKIDTATGQTWIFSWRTEADGTIIKEWQIVE